MKNFLRAEMKGDDLPPDFPVRHDHFHPRLKTVSKAIRAGDAEARRNPRARSAVLRVAERTEETTSA